MPVTEKDLDALFSEQRVALEIANHVAYPLVKALVTMTGRKIRKQRHGLYTVTHANECFSVCGLSLEDVLRELAIWVDSPALYRDLIAAAHSLVLPLFADYEAKAAKAEVANNAWTQDNEKTNVEHLFDPSGNVNVYYMHKG